MKYYVHLPAIKVHSQIDLAVRKQNSNKIGNNQKTLAIRPIQHPQEHAKTLRQSMHIC